MNVCECWMITVILIFKWNQDQIKVKEVINAITDYKPLFGHTTKNNGTTIWM